MVLVYSEFVTDRPSDEAAIRVLLETTAMLACLVKPATF
jgi:hypothetical protein